MADWRFSVPAAGDAVSRPQLARRLGEAGGHVWMCAPAGSGKTTLAVELLNNAKAPAAWYRVDALDGGVGTFFSHLVAALRPLGVRRVPRIDPGLQETPVAFARHLAGLLEGRLPRECLLVLDDYHLLPDDEALHQAIAAFVGGLPRGARVVVTSRAAIPPAWARLEVDPGVVEVGPEALAFDAKELQAAARALGVRPSPDDARRILERTRGWAAGLVLLLRTPLAQLDAALTHPDGIFRFYAGELLAHATPERRRFLEQLALLPSMTPETAARLTGLRDAGRRLEALHREQLFIERHRQLWVFHPLFREFLLERLRRDTPPPEYRRLCAAAAEALEDSDGEAAFGLWLEADEAPRALELTLRTAQARVEAGRWASLLEAFGQLPAALVEGSAQARLWRGTCLLHRDTAAALRDFRAAFTALRAGRRWEEMHLAWCGAVQAVLYEFGDFEQFDEWLDAWADFERTRTPRAPLATRLRQKVLLFAALMVRRPLDPALPGLEKTLHRLVFYAPLAPAQRLQVAANLLRALAWRGDLERSGLLVERLERVARGARLDPLSALLWRLVETMYAWYGRSPAEGLEAAERGLALAREVGVHHMDFTFLVQAAHAAFARGDVARARDVIDAMAHSLDEARVVHFGHHQFFRAWLDFADGEGARALRRLEPCHALAVRCGAPYVLVQNDYGYAMALFLCGRADEARAVNDAALEVATRCGYGPQRYLLLLNRAHFAFSTGDERQADEALGAALAVGRAGGYRLVPYWTHQLLAPLLARALERGLEADYAREVIAAQGVLPHGAAAASWAWPRRVSLRLLGGLEVLVEGRPLAFHGKVQRRPLELLALLGVRRRVRVAEAADTLWPESDGSSAQDSLKTTLARLRKLVGADAVVQREGALWLEPSVLSCDVWALEAALAQHEAGAGGGEAVRRLYRGALLAGDDGAGWVVAPAEVLRRRVLAALEREVAAGLEAGAPGAVDFAEAAVEVDPLGESGWRLLLRAYVAQGRAPEARRAYQRCEALLRQHLGVAPSPLTRAALESGAGQRP